MKRRNINYLAIAIGLGMASAVPLVAQNKNPTDLTEASLEDLMNVRVISVSKKEQPLLKTGAAVYVISQEDIRRSGITNIPDLLRMAPGVDVARIDANAWAISIRGFNSRYSNKVLVLIDGRSVYTPTFSGVFWDQVSTAIEDIDRIEVIRGPGGTVWGANAVNGVVNIITKSSKDTQGGLVTAGAGSEESLRGVVRYGSKLGHQGLYRVFGRYANVESGILANGTPAPDGWRSSQGGFRADWNASPRDTLVVDGDLFRANEGENLTIADPRRLFETRTFNDQITVGSGDLQGRWGHTFANGSESSLRVSYTRFSRFDQARYDESATDGDFQYHFTGGARQDFVSGVAYRHSTLNFRDGYATSFNPGSPTTNLFSTFLQDEIRLASSVALTIGSKFEHNGFTGFEFEPSAQLVWTPSTRTTFWMSGARAIRQPSWLEQTFQGVLSTVPLPGGTLGVVQLQGNAKIAAESLYDLEVGYRTQLSKRVSLDATTFWSRYHDLQTIEPGAPFFALSPAPPHLVFPESFDNRANARDYGGELFANWSVSKRWQISSGFSYLQMKISRDASSQDSMIEGSTGTSPKYQGQLRSALGLPHSLEWDVSTYFVGSLSFGPVPSYTRLDTRFGWRAGEFLEFSVAGQNLLTPRHFESFTGYQINSTQVERSVVGKATWRW